MRSHHSIVVFLLIPLSVTGVAVSNSCFVPVTDPLLPTTHFNLSLTLSLLKRSRTATRHGSCEGSTVGRTVCLVSLIVYQQCLCFAVESFCLPQIICCGCEQCSITYDCQFVDLLVLFVRLAKQRFPLLFHPPNQSLPHSYNRDSSQELRFHTFEPRPRGRNVHVSS